jgi:predicted nucleic acid-binding protein
VIVLDASIVVEILLGGGRASALHTRLTRTGESWHAPSLVEVEVVSVLRRLNLLRQLSDLRGRQALQALPSLPLRLHAHGPLLPRAWALRANLSAYDAMYVALAEGLPAPLLTLDARLAATSGHHARIELPLS